MVLTTGRGVLLASSEWAELRDAATDPTVHRTASWQRSIEPKMSRVSDFKDSG